MMGAESKMPCFAVGVATATSALRQRFQLHLSADEAEQFVETDLIAKSFGSYYTRLYVPPCLLFLPACLPGAALLNFWFKLLALAFLSVLYC